MKNDLTLLSYVGHIKKRRHNLYLCVCGKKVVIRENAVNSGNTKSCGCRRKRLKINSTHGKSSTIEYKTWKSLKRRCYGKNSTDYKLYGGRGISVCDRWLNSFESFLKDMGLRPSSKHSIDRIDSNGNYSPDNCRWATVRQQQINRSCSIVYKGEMASEASLRLGGNICMVGKRVKELGWSKKEAFNTPKGFKKHS